VFLENLFLYLGFFQIKKKNTFEKTLWKKHFGFFQIKKKHFDAVSLSTLAIFAEIFTGFAILTIQLQSQNRHSKYSF
jgi:hypothetical protein